MLERIIKLETLFPEAKMGEQRNPGKEYQMLKKLAIQEKLVNLYHIEQYGLSLFLTFIKLQEDIDDSYAKLYVGKNFEALYKAKRKYQFNRHVDIIIPNEQSPDYQQFLSFLWNLKLHELKAFADYYANPNKTTATVFGDDQ